MRVLKNEVCFSVGGYENFYSDGFIQGKPDFFRGGCRREGGSIICLSKLGGGYFLLADGGERNVDAFFADMSGIACGIYSSGKRPVPGRNFYRKNNRIIRPNVEK